MTRAIYDPNRNPDGTFAPGNKASLGVSKGKGHEAQAAKERRNKYSRQIEEVVSAEDMQEIALQAVKDAKAGDRYARDWLTNYLIGRPVQRVQQSDEDESPLANLLRQLAEDEDEDEDEGEDE